VALKTLWLVAATALCGTKVSRHRLLAVTKRLKMLAAASSVHGATSSSLTLGYVRALTMTLQTATTWQGMSLFESNDRLCNDRLVVGL